LCEIDALATRVWTATQEWTAGQGGVHALDHPVEDLVGWRGHETSPREPLIMQDRQQRVDARISAPV
jgi:hypothetical protein